MRKFEPLFYKINTHLQKTITCIGDCGQNIFCKCLIYIFFRFWAWHLRLLFYDFSEVIKKFWNNFYCIVLLLFVWAKKVSQIFKILFQTEDISSFVLLGVFYSICVQLKSLFSAEKNILKVLKKFNVAGNQSKIPSLAEVGALQSCS